MRRDERHQAEREAADGRLPSRRQAAFLEEIVDEGHPAHDGDAERGTGERQHGQPRDARERRVEAGRDVADEIAADPERPRHEHAGDRRRHDGGEPERRVGADDQLESVEGAGERCPEGGADRRAGAGADDGAHVGAAEVEGAAEPGGEARSELRIAGLEPDRGAEAVRDQGLQPDRDRILHRHAAAVQRIRFDRIDGAAPTQARRQARGAPEQQAARRRDQIASQGVFSASSALIDPGPSSRNSTPCSTEAARDSATVNRAATMPATTERKIRPLSRARTPWRRALNATSQRWRRRELVPSGADASEAVVTKSCPARGTRHPRTRPRLSGRTPRPTAPASASRQLPT